MKTTFRKLGSILLVLCIIAALLPCAAFATDDMNEDIAEDSMSVSGAVGLSLSGNYWSTWNGEDITDLGLDYSDYPDGVSIHKSSNNAFVVEGTPTEGGDYQVTATVSTQDQTYIVDIYFTIESGYDRPETSYDSTLTGKVGVALTGWAWATPDGMNIGDIMIDQGSLPAGMTIPTPGSNAFQITGTPTTAGNGTCMICVETAENIFYVNLTWTISGDEFAITKSPTSESTSEGGSATFIASASNYSYVEWLLIKNGSTMASYQGETNTSYNGCTVVTYKDNGKEYLVLKNIPSSMNGYTVQARFTNKDKGSSILTQSCSLSVAGTTLKSPTISSQPSAATETVGKSVVLTVAATDPNSGTLKYQWYSNKSASTAGGSAISGATSASYTVPQTEGTTYYYCSITSTKNGNTSTAVTTSPVAVTYNAAVASPSPSPSTSPNPSDSPSPSVSPTTVPSSGTSKGNTSGLLILLIVLILLSAAALIFLVLYMRKRSEEGIEDDVVEPFEKAEPARVQLMRKWTCPECGAKNRAGSRFCSECGAANPNTNQKR